MTLACHIEWYLQEVINGFLFNHLPGKLCQSDFGISLIESHRECGDDSGQAMHSCCY